jgi:ABC-type multidrug transport system fused ATPase/permease subunit
MLDPDAGSIRMGGVPLAAIDEDELRAAVVPVFQETFLFADTIRENLTLGLDLSDHELRRVAALCRADEFIAELPQGYDTVVGERGVTLSGGQRQRVALTRALLRRPRVLLLDDATSAVDPRIEAEILANLRSELDTTLVVVAYRLATIRLADRVLYLADGRIVADGRHEALLARPDYSALVRAYEQGRVA